MDDGTPCLPDFRGIVVFDVWGTNHPFCERVHVFTPFLQKAPDRGSSIFIVDLTLDKRE